ncbi:unnamed protein product (macronuclear) [Paramecium tetraurelia]|uniref:Alcohol dehydrogenase-like N-terminal domain-containing protein n=1 Tax=Paramecium tetraurelia TaxID=5888 RepID=A0EHX1_PARTE|nr:uncharacterized protein GSPATT00027239001 [Paramecium tetraurelia]CAK94912.1 unnamed protein product [Paramecium tetraurelia]|eukprot:XP_001462285.1 hypothetical protein (macronuclear) [Paramecium tetraurelia strain d4-2]
MKAFVISKYGTKPLWQQVLKPSLLSHQVLIKVRYAPVNPSDIYYSLGIYGIKKALPTQLGMEGVGEVVEGKQKGKLVAFLPARSVGSWAEYVAANENDIYEVANEIQGSMAIINPFTVLGFQERAKQFKSILFSSARSSTAIQGIKLFKELGKDVWAISKENKDYVNTILDDENLISNVQKNIKDKTIFFDSTSGDKAGTILTSLPGNSVLVNYGSSTAAYIGKINPNQLIFNGKSVEGFWMHNYYTSLTRQQKEVAFNYINSKLDTVFKSDIYQIVKPQDISGEELYKLQSQTRGQGKILLEFK